MAEEIDKAHRFQQSVSLEIQKHKAMTVMGTYAEVFEATQCQKQTLGEGKQRWGRRAVEFLQQSTR